MLNFNNSVSLIYVIYYDRDGMPTGYFRPTRKQHLRHYKQMKESANLNRDPYMHHTVIPRTQRIQKEQVC